MKRRPKKPESAPPVRRETRHELLCRTFRRPENQAKLRELFAANCIAPRRIDEYISALSQGWGYPLVVLDPDERKLITAMQNEEMEKPLPRR